MKRARWVFGAAAVAGVVVLVVPAVGQGKAQPAALKWSRSRGGATIASSDFGTFAYGASVSRWFWLGSSSSTKSGRLGISLYGVPSGPAPAFSITADRCAGKSIGKKLSCWVRVAYTPQTGGLSDDEAVLWANSGDGEAGLVLSGSCRPSEPKGTKHLYWVDESYGKYGTVNKVPVGGGCMTTLATGQDDPGSIAVDATHVYWVNLGRPSSGGGYPNGTVNEVPIGGGTVTTLATGPSAAAGPGASVAVDGTHVYWIGGGNVKKVPIGGGSVTILASGQDHPRSLATDGSNVYWVNETSVNQVPVGGGSVTTLATGGVINTAVAVDATHVYWLDAGTAPTTVNEVPIGGGSVTTLGTGGFVPWSLAVDSTHVYWADLGCCVREVPLGGGTVTNLATGQTNPWSVAVDGDHVYWVNVADWSAGDPTGTGTVNALWLGGGSPTTLAAGLTDPSSVVVGP